MSKFTIKGIRRREAGGPVQVLVEGGWMKWFLVSEEFKAGIHADPRLTSVRNPLAPDGWVTTPFEITLQSDQFDHDWDGERDAHDESDGGDSRDASEGDASDGESQDSQRQGNGDTDPKFDNPFKGDGSEGDASDNAGDDGFMVTHRHDDDENTLEPFDDAFLPRAEALGQAVMAQTVEFVRGDIAEAVAAITGDVKEALATIQEDTESRYVTHGQLDQKLAEFSPKKDSDGSAQYIVKVEIRQGGTVRDVEGLAHSSMPKLMKYVASGQHVYLPGPPGTGKSHAAQQVVKALSTEENPWMFGSISFGPTTPESRLWGGMDAHGSFHETALIQGLRYAANTPTAGSVFCGDELDNGHPGILATVNSLMANGWVTLPNGETITVGPNWVFIGCANTFGTGPTSEFAGRNRLDAATLDRFAYLPWDTDLGVERALVEAHLAEAKAGTAAAWLDVWKKTRENVEKNGLKVFVTMRGAINGAKLIAGGETISEAWHAVLGNKLPADQLKKASPL